MRRFVVAVSTIAFVAGILLSTAAPASASTPADKPVVTILQLTVYSSGGASPDTWHTSVTVPLGGHDFTPGGNVYVTYQDLTAGTPALNGEWVKAGAGSCGLECSNYGKLSYTRTLSFGYRAVCGHVLRAWAWDEVKSPQSGYGWSWRDVQVSC